MARSRHPGLEGLDRGGDGAAALMTEHHDQPARLVSVGPELDAAEHYTLVQGLPAGPDHEEIANSAVKNDLWRHPRVDAGENEREWSLVRGDLKPPGDCLMRVLKQSAYPPLVSLTQQIESIRRFCHMSLRAERKRNWPIGAVRQARSRGGRLPAWLRQVTADLRVRAYVVQRASQYRDSYSTEPGTGHTSVEIITLGRSNTTYN